MNLEKRYRIWLGGNIFGYSCDATTAAEIMTTAFTLGINSVDTSSSYSNGLSEKIIGRWIGLNDKRENWIISTKVGMQSGETPSGLGKKESIFQSAQRSQDNLQTDYLDVLFLHNPDPTTNEAETVDSMVELFEGKVIKSIGFSNVDDTQLNRYMNSLRRNSIYEIPIYVQNEFNWSTRKSSFWALLLENYQDFKIFSVSYGVLQQGLLAQTFENYKRSQIQDEMKRANKSIKVGNFLTNKKLEDCLKALDIELNSMGSNLFEFSMNFSLKYSNYSIWGVRNLEQLKKLDSETSVNLTDLEFTRLENKYLT